LKKRTIEKILKHTHSNDGLWQQSFPKYYLLIKHLREAPATTKEKSPPLANLNNPVQEIQVYLGLPQLGKIGKNAQYFLKL
jgi:hypothetical protein